MKSALCIGINDYGGQADLNGCVNDAIGWMDVLAHLGFDVRVLLDGEATRKSILDILKNMVGYASSGDVIVMTYSGHGTQVPDQSGDEEDYYDEALYVRDGVLLDDQLREILNQIPEGVAVYIILDSCFSGTATRYASPYTEGVKERFIKLESTPKLTPELKRTGKFLQEFQMQELLLTGSSDSEYSYDAYFDGMYYGAMSYNALQVIQENPFGLTWEEFYTELRKRLPSYNFPQTPQLEGNSGLKSRLMFSGYEVEEPEPPSEPAPPAPPEEGGKMNFLDKIIEFVAKIVKAIIYWFSEKF